MKAILIVEDEALIRALLEEVLIIEGFDVYVAGSVQAAIPWLDRDGPNLAGLITDIQLGDKKTGWDIARHARSANSDVHVIYMSGTCGDDWQLQGVSNSVFIQKPFAVAQIVGAVAKLLDNYVGEVA